MDLTTRIGRVMIANRLITTIAAHGRRFFDHTGDKSGARLVSHFTLDARNRVRFVDGYSGHPVYVAYKYEWRGFSQGGTMRAVVRALAAYIRTGTPYELHLGPWPAWYSDGDPWGYGADMERVREVARECKLIPALPVEMPALPAPSPA